MELQFSKGTIFLAYFVAICAAGPLTSKTDDEKLLEKSHEMRSYMNETVNPCQNFYEFTCGNWKRIHPAGDANTETSFMIHIKQSHDEKAIAMLKDTADPVDTDIDKKVKKYFRSCIYIMENKLDTDKVIGIIEEFGEMPVLSNKWDEKEFDWVETLAKIIKTYGYQIMLGFEIAKDIRDNTKNRIYIGETDYELESKSIYLEPAGENYRNIYKENTAVQLETLLGVDEETARETGEEIVEFEILLARGLTGTQNDENLSSQLSSTTVDKLHAKYAPTFDVKKFFTIILGDIPNEMIYEYPPTFLENLVDAVQKTDKRVIANYIFFQLIKPYLIETGKPEEETETYCLGKTNEKFAKNIDNMMYRRLVDKKEIEENLYRIWNNLKALFKERLQSSPALNWMSKETRENAIKKLDALKLDINSYANWDFESELNRLETSEDDYIGNLRNITMLSAKRDLRIEKLDEPVTPVDAGETLSFTPANILTENTVKVPVALLKPYSVWAKNYPDALKFGILGFLLGHEMVHTFDETGRQFGKHGNLEDWWDPQSVHEFEERRTCFRDQYHNYMYGESLLPSTKNQAENIADNSGFQLAYEAYKNARTNAIDANDDQMPDLPYKSEQLFFIGFAQFWCHDIQEFYRNLQTQIDEHTPAPLRTIGVIANSKEFSKVFECEAGSQMNPTTKCAMY